MKTMHFIQRPDTDKFVRVAVPVDDAEQNYRVTVILETESPSDNNKLADEWPPGFIDRTFGAWKGELERSPQGDYPERATF